MDIFLPIVIFIVLFIFFFMCGICCRRKTQGQIFSSPVIITSTTHEPADMSQQTAYQSTQATPGPQMGYPAQGGYVVYPGAQPGYPAMPQYPPQQYPTQAPYPVNGPQGMPQPMQSPQDGMPARPMPAPGALPPPYSEVVRQEAYAKQSPFNPNY